MENIKFQVSLPKNKSLFNLKSYENFISGNYYVYVGSSFCIYTTCRHVLKVWKMGKSYCFAGDKSIYTLWVGTNY